MSLRKTVRIFDTATDIAAFIVCLILFLIGMYSIYDSYMAIREASDESVLKYKPGYDEGADADSKDILPGMVAWLTVDGTKIDYPVMHGQDNMEFLNKNPFGDYSLAGSIFLDYRNKGDFSDPYNLIYGHHMEEGVMFGSLDDFIRQDFLASHSTGRLVVGDDTYDILFYAAFHAQATDISVFSPAEQDGSEVIAYAKENAKALMPERELVDGDTVVALSTCRYPESIERTVVIGALKKRIVLDY